MDTEQLVTTLATKLGFGNAINYQGNTIDVSLPWPRLPVREAFIENAGWDPVTDYEPERFDHDMATLVLPKLESARPTVLVEYPAAAASLARLKTTDPKIAERSEVFIGGLELANAYSELTDPVEQRARFEKWGVQRKALGKTVYPIDEEFIQCLEAIPPSGGCALGVDRLLMALLGTTTLDDILPFRD